MEGLADDRDAFSETMPVGAESLGTLGAIEAVTRLGGEPHLNRMNSGSVAILIVIFFAQQH